MKKRTICAFTGHRPQKLPWGHDEYDDRCIALKLALMTEIENLINAGVADFLSGMAEGVDTWAALAVLAYREQNPALKLHCILPCKEQEEHWKVSSQKTYHSVLEQADSIVYVSREKRKNCMLARDRFLVAHADILLAVYNGEKRGGTAATVRYAQKQGLEIWRIDPITRLVSHETAPPTAAANTHA